MIECDRMPQWELDIVRKLPDIQVVFDVGARIDTAYLGIFPNAEFHLFEPCPDFFEELELKVGKNPKVHLNNFGLDEKEGELPYDPRIQSFRDYSIYPKLPLSTLDKYVSEREIQRIDFLKVDTEGLDYRVLLGGRNTIKRCRYIEYEHWDDRMVFHKLLEDEFIMCYIGERNVLCIRKGQPWI